MPGNANKAARTQVKAYAVADHLRTPEKVAAYLDDWLNEAPNDAAGIAKAIGDIRRARDVGEVAKGVS